jgi:hypothetical protein
VWYANSSPVIKPGEDRLTHATLIRRFQTNKEKTEKKYKEIYDIGLNFVVTPNRQVRITELAPGFVSHVFLVCVWARMHGRNHTHTHTHTRARAHTHTHTHTHTPHTHTPHNLHRGPAAKLGFIGIGDVIVALDEEPIPTEPDADIAAFINARICGPKGSPGLGFRV